MTTKKRQAGQVYFEISDYQKIKNAAQKHNLSFAEFMRQAALEKLQKEEQRTKVNRYFSVKPFNWKSKYPNDGAKNHDKYIYGATK